MQNAYKYFTPVLLAVGLVACGGGGGDGVKTVSYSGKTTPADFSSLSPEQKKEVVNNTGSAFLDAQDNADPENAQSPIPFAAGVSAHKPEVSNLVALSLRLAKENDLASLPVGASVDMSENLCTGGGKASTSGSGDEKSGSSTMKFSNCVFGEGDYTTTINGTFSMKYSETSYKMEYSDFRMTHQEEEGQTWSSAFNGYYSLEGVGMADIGDLELANFTAKWSLTAEFEYELDGKKQTEKVSSSGEMTCKNGACSFTVAVKDADGKTYKVVIEADKSVTFSHPDHGTFTIKDYENLEACEEGDEAPFDGSFTVKDDKGNTLTYQAGDCSATPTYTFN